MTRNKDWLRYSEELVEIADLLMKNEKHSWACFTLEQASSAALKAILSKEDKSTFGENLIKLMKLIRKSHKIPENVEKACHYVNDYFSKTRNLENKTEGTPLDYYTVKDTMKVKKHTMVILRYAFHLANN